jgi:hypothetical protein
MYANWSMFPLMMAISYTTYLLFLGDSPQRPLYQRVIYSIVQKPIFGLVVALTIIGLVTRAESEYNYVLFKMWVVVSFATRSAKREDLPPSWCSLGDRGPTINCWNLYMY